MDACEIKNFRGESVEDKGLFPFFFFLQGIESDESRVLAGDYRAGYFFGYGWISDGME